MCSSDLITGDHAEYFEDEELSIITGKAMFMQVDDEDTLFLHADTLKTTYDSTGLNRILYAFNKVKFFKADMQGKCDSLVYSDGDSIIDMYNEPILWVDENQITARFIKIKTSGEIGRAHV